MKGIRAGQESAYALLFEQFYRPLSVFATTYIDDLDTAKEIVQDLFVHIYENRRTLVISTSLKSYLYQSVRNRCLNHLKHDLVKKKHLDQVALEQNPSEDLEERIMENELEHEIFRIVSGLAPKCQEIFKMSRIEGLNNREIASRLGISVRTVETQISKALRALRGRLGDHLSFI